MFTWQNPSNVTTGKPGPKQKQMDVFPSPNHLLCKRSHLHSLAIYSFWLGLGFEVLLPISFTKHRASCHDGLDLREVKPQ